ncbi:cardiolipin synthase [bacterium]|nr:cardiolipin synthase [bacterium]
MDGIAGRAGRAISQRFPRLADAASYLRKRKKRFVALFLVIAHIAGALTSVRAIMTVRTSQGAVAWAVALNTFPYLAVPAYWVFGHKRFDGDLIRRRGGHEKSGPILSGFDETIAKKSLLAPGHDEVGNRLRQRLARLPATTGNDVELLRNGDAIFPSIFDGIDGAKHYILVQFYIVRNDALGIQLKQHLLSAVKRGVKVHFVYDEIGSQKLPDSHIEEMTRAGVEMLPFNTMKGLTNRFQLNFRNHRKTVITDGRAAWVGGMNIGDEYNGSHEELSPWHDTAVKVTGPAVQTIQFAFLEDWLWASDRLLNLQWEPEAAPSGARKSVLCLATGPADPVETATLYFLQHINSATRRLWISSPYFVPDEQIISALELAALRGVEIRILVPDKTDDALVNLSGWAFVERLGRVGVKFYRHTDGFMHQKVTLVDSALATVGTSNFDNRSFRLNFEMTLEVRDEAFAREVATLLENDFARSRAVDPMEVTHRGFLFKLKVRAAHLLSPIQ